VQVKREEEKLLATVGGVMRDREVLYGTYGLWSHFEAFMVFVEAEGRPLGTRMTCPPI
jgi:hypothetical protein